MLYLAQVTKNILSGALELQLLACQKTESEWLFCEEKYLVLSKETQLHDGVLILVEIDENNNIIRFRELKNWLLNFMRQYLTNGDVTPDFIEEEQIRIEKWRQELTSQSQDLTRRNLEIEARREELQKLEESLNLEKKKLQIKFQEEEQEK